jgi:hypothetical protein
MHASRWRRPRTRKEAIRTFQVACFLGAVVVALLSVGFALEIVGRSSLQRTTSTVDSITYHPAYKGYPWIEVDLDGDSHSYVAYDQLPGGLQVGQVHGGDRIDLW